MNPAIAPVMGLVVYLGAVVLNLASSAGEPTEQDVTDWVTTLAIAAFGVGIAVAASQRAVRRGGESAARTSLAMGVVAALTFVVFWTGFPCVFGAAAIGLAVSSRPPSGRMGTPGIAGVLLGALGLVAGAMTMVVG
jgi:Kef-type K+ transport system membrane component KefB